MWNHSLCVCTSLFSLCSRRLPASLAPPPPRTAAPILLLRAMMTTSKTRFKESRFVAGHLNTFCIDTCVRIVLLYIYLYVRARDNSFVHHYAVAYVCSGHQESPRLPPPEWLSRPQFETPQEVKAAALGGSQIRRPPPQEEEVAETPSPQDKGFQFFWNVLFRCFVSRTSGHRRPLL